MRVLSDEFFELLTFLVFFFGFCLIVVYGRVKAWWLNRKERER